MTADERNEQILRLACGNAHFENEVNTKTNIDEAMETLSQGK